MPLTNFPNGITSFGVPQFGPGGLVPVPGDVYWIHPGNAASVDGNSGLSPERARVTISSVQSSMTANQNDAVMLIGNSSAAATNVVSESAAVAWSKNLTHIMGTSFTRVAHRSSIRASSTSMVETLTLSADGVVMANFHITNQSSGAAANQCINYTGQRGAFYNLHIAAGFNQTGADRNDLSDLLMNGSGEDYFENCTIGLDTVDRAGTGANVRFTACKNTARVEFKGCRFISITDNSTFTPLVVPAASIDRYLIFDDCLFINPGVASGRTQLAEAFDISATAGGIVILKQTFVADMAAVEATNTNRVFTQDLYGAGTTALGVESTV